MMEKKQCGAADWAVNEAASCFQDDMEYPICCMHINSPATDSLPPSERDWVYEAIQKANGDTKSLSWCTNTPDNCTQTLQG